MDENQTTTLADLNADPKNPRTISRESFDKLKLLLKEYGELSGIIRNRRTNQLIGGHSRVQAFRQLGASEQIQITQRFDTPTATGTLEIGYVMLDGEPHSYRLVDWDETKQKTANIAANASSDLADWDKDLLSQTVFELSQLENSAQLLEMTALAENDLKELNKMIGVLDEEPEPIDPDAPENNKLEFALTREQREIVEEALGNIKASRDMAAEQNSSQNGNALYYMARDYLDRLHGLIESNETPIQPAN